MHGGPIRLAPERKPPPRVDHQRLFAARSLSQAQRIPGKAGGDAQHASEKRLKTDSLPGANVMAEPIWDEFLTERDKQVFAASGYGVRGGFGKRPALLVIDVNY